MSNEYKDWLANRYQTVNKYEELCEETALYPAKDSDLTYPIIGLAGEVGELCNKYKKVLRGDYTEEQLESIKKDIADEMGDVLWYLTRIVNTLGYSLVDIMEINSVKLSDRMNRGVIKGSGDKR